MKRSDDAFLELTSWEVPSQNTRRGKQTTIVATTTLLYASYGGLSIIL